MDEKSKNFKDLNKQIRECKKCSLWKTRGHALPGEGNIRAKLFLMAQAPGYNEDREGKMFIGPSGKVLDDLLKVGNVRREEVYMTNLVKCMLPKYRKPKQEEIETCSNYLDKEIEMIKPKVLVPLGYHATRYTFNKYGLSSPPKKQIHEVYGRLFLAEAVKIFPLPHPAAVLYNEAIKGTMIEDYCKLKVLLTTCKWYSACPMKRFYEQGRMNKKWVELYCKGDWERCVRYQMEEKGEAHSDQMLPNGTPMKEEK